MRYWRVRSITTRQDTTASSVPDRPEAHRQRRDEDQQQADRRGGRDQDLVGDPGVGADPRRVDLVGVGGDVGRREQLVDLVPVTPSASHGKTLPASTTRASAVVSTTAGSNEPARGQQPGGQEDRADHDRRERQGAALAEPDHADQPGDQRAAAGAGDREAEEVAVLAAAPASARRRRRTTQPIQATATAASGSCWARESTIAPGDQRDGDDGGGDPGQQRGVLDQQRHRAERHQQAGRHEGGTASGRRRPRLEVALDHVGHRLDDVVVDPRRRLVDAGGDGEQPAVLDALDGQPGVGGELAALAR